MFCFGRCGVSSNMPRWCRATNAVRNMVHCCKTLWSTFAGENHPNLFLHSNGLLYANGTEKAITWMNSTANGRPVIPRTGYIVEINALWYNALRFTSELLSEGGNNNLADALNVLAEKTGKAFVDTFLNEYGYLLDYVDGLPSL